MTNTMVLSGAQVAGYAHIAGFSGDSLVTILAISKAESSWNALAHNQNASTGDDSYGCCQINMIGQEGPDRRAKYHLSSNNDLFNPLTNFRVAFGLSGGGRDFSPWSTYKNGAYRGNIPAAQQAIRDLQAQGPQFEHDLKANAGQSASWWDTFIAGLQGASAVTGGANGTGLVDVPGAADKVGNTVNGIPNALTNGFNALTSQFTKLGGNFLAIGVALVLLVVGIVLLSRGAIGSAVRTVKP